MSHFKLVLIVAASFSLSVIGSDSAFGQYYGISPYGTWSGPGHYHGGAYYSGAYVPGYSVGSHYGAPYTNYGLYSGGYYGLGSATYLYGPGVSAGYGYGHPRPVIVTPAVPLGTTTTIIRGGPTGGVVEYTQNGNGYTYTPGSSYSSVVNTTPTLGLSRTYVIDGPKPVVVESRPSSPASNPSGLSKFSPSKSLSNIKLSCPKAAPGALNYTLNGHPYTIRPGYSQTFPDDRAWTIEFKRGGDDSEVASYTLKAGVYLFVATPSGWDLQQPEVSTAPLELPPPPIPPAPEPSL